MLLFLDRRLRSASLVPTLSAMRVGMRQSASEARAHTRCLLTFGRRRPLLLLAALAAAAILASPLQAGNGRAMLAALNAQRTANGIPAVGWSDDWAAKCALHNAFEQRN